MSGSEIPLRVCRNHWVACARRSFALAVYMSALFFRLGFVAVVLPVFAGLATQGASLLPQTSEDLFRLDRVWNIELNFARDQWRALQPIEPENRSFLSRASDLALALGPMVFKAADANGDRQVTRQEFEKLGEQWFEKWDTDHTGQLTETQLRVGLSTALKVGLGTALALPDGALDSWLLQAQEGKRNGLSSARGIEFNYVHGDLLFEGQLLPDVAVRYKGNGTYLQSAHQLKRPFKVDLNEFTKGQKLAGMAKLNLHNNITDASWMNEALAYRLYRDAGVPAPRVGYARLRLTVPDLHTNTPLGLYTMVENIDSNFSGENFGTKKGLLLKPSTAQLFNYLGEDWDKYKQIYDPKTPVYATQAKRVIAFAKLLTESNDADFVAAVPDYIDFDEVSRFLAVTVWISTLDSILGMGQNFVIHLHPKTQKLQLMPWDLDHAFGQFGLRGSQEEREQLSIREAWNPEVRFLARLMKVPAFEEAYLARLGEFQTTLFQPARLVQQVDELATVIRDSVRLDGEEKRARFEKAVAGEPVAPVRPFIQNGAEVRPDRSRAKGSTPPSPPSPAPVDPGEFGNDLAKPIKGFVGLRHASVAAQLSGTSSGKKLSPASARNPGAWIAAQWLNAMDENGDRVLTKTEFTSKLKKWFTDWDLRKTGTLNEDALKDGLSEVLRLRPKI